MKNKVLMIVLNNVIYDPRVIREALTLQNANYQLEIWGIKQKPSDRSMFFIHGIKVQLLKLHSKDIFPKNTIGWFIKYLELILKLNFKLIFTKFRIVHAHNLDALFPIFFQSKLLKRKIVYDSHELFTQMSGKRDNIINKSWASLEKFIINKVDLVFSANESRSEIMYKELQARKRPISLLNIPMGFIGRDNNKNFYKDIIPNKKKIVLYQGMINEYRNIENLIRSSKYFKDDLMLVLIGKFSSAQYRMKIEKLIKTEYSSKVIILESVAQQKLFHITQKAHIGVIIYDKNSLNNFLCAPNKLYEYASVGIPVAGSNLPEIRKILSKYQIGELFNENTPNLIAESINKIYKNYEKYSQDSKFISLFSDHNWIIEQNKLSDHYNNL